MSRHPTAPASTPLRLVTSVAIAALGCSGGSGSPSQSGGPAQPPEITSVEPRVAGRSFPLTIEGRNFGGPALTEDVAPTLTIARTRDLDGHAVDGPTGSDLVPVDVVGSVERIQVYVTLPEWVPAGLWGFSLTTRWGRVASFPDAVALLDLPTLSGAFPDAVCLATTASIGLVGIDFAEIDGAGPAVTLGNGVAWSWDPCYFSTVAAATLAGCTRVPFERAEVKRCTRIDVPFPENTPAGAIAISVAPPPPLWGPALVASVFADRPFALRQGLGPFAVVEGPHAVTVNDWLGPFCGVPVHSVGGAPPAAWVDGVPAACSVSDCRESGVPGHSVCGGVAVTLPQGLASGPHTVAVRTMPWCRETTTVSVVGRPTITAVDPAVVCRYAELYEVRGVDFFQPRVFVGGVEQDATCMSSWFPPEPCNTISVSAWRSPRPALGTQDVTVLNQTTPPLGSAPFPVLVASGPPGILSVAPATMYGGIEHTVAVGLAEGVTTITGVALAAGTSRVELAFQQSAGRLAVALPAGLANAWYALAVTEGTFCTAIRANELMILDSYDLRSETFDAEAGSTVFVTWEGRNWDPSPPTAWHEAGGNPGGAISHGTDGAGPAWYFAANVLWGLTNYDLAPVRFDLRRAAGGTDLAAPDVILHLWDRSLERALPAAPGAEWTTYEVALDDPAGWTYRDASGTREATAADLGAVLAAWPELWIRGQYGAGANETWLDNLVVELRH